jgi:hypothetical protein
MTDERVTQQQAREAMYRLAPVFTTEQEAADYRALLAFIAQHPDTQGEAVAWVVRGRSDGRIWMVDLDRDEALACATEAGDTLIPLYASPPSDSGVSPQAGEASPSSEGSLRRALLALADRWTAIVGDEGANFGRHCCAQDLRELAGQGTLSVGSSDEVAP